MSGWNAFLIVLRKDLLRKIRSPLAAIVMLLFPVLFSLLIGVTFGGGGGMPPIKIAFVDQDGGLIGRLVRSSLGQDQMPLRFDVQVADSAAAVRLIENDKVSAILRIPPGFSDSLLASKPTYLEVVKNPAEQVYPGIAEEYVEVLAQLGSAVLEVFGEPIGEIRDAIEATTDAPDVLVSRISVAINHRMQSVSRYAFPPAISIEEVRPEAKPEEHEIGSPFRVAAFVFPGMAVFALLTLALVSMSDVQREGARGTLSRQFAAPIPFGAVILGKIGATWVLSLACILILVIMAMLWAGSGIPLTGFLVLSLLFALTATGFAAFIQSLSRSERTGSAIGSIIIMVMAMAGGAWIPLEMLPGAAKSIAPFTLIYWGSQGYRDLLFESAKMTDLLPNFLVLLVCGGLFSLVAILLFRRRYGSGV
jgi:ABC-type multidrug transport system permease subunit